MNHSFQKLGWTKPNTSKCFSGLLSNGRGKYTIALKSGLILSIKRLILKHFLKLSHNPQINEASLFLTIQISAKYTIKSL